MTARFGTAMTTFQNYKPAEPGGAMGSGTVPAARVTEESVQHIRKHWNLPNIWVGMWLLLMPNGDGVAISATNFAAKYVLANP